VPAEGQPQVEMRVDYSLRGHLLGFIEIGKVEANASAAVGSKAILFARSERSLGWFKLPADTLLSDGEKLLR
jgi:hypothetical protein